MNEKWESDLSSAARLLRNLLRDVDSASEPLWRGRQLAAAIHRYVEIFLPMLAAYAGRPNVSELTLAANRKLAQSYLDVVKGEMYRTKLLDEEQKQYTAPFVRLGDTKNAAAVAPIPPLDVAFCWALHRLSPLDYAADCKKLFGAPLPTDNGLDYIGVHNVEEERAVVARLQWDSFARAVRQRETQKPFKFKACRKERKTFLPSYLWPTYEKDGKYHLFEFDEKERWMFESKWVSPLRYDLVAAAARQKQFLYNVSATYFDGEEALLRGTRRYRQFLTLMRHNPGKFLVPMYDIDLVWHAHILKNTKEYAEFTKKFVGRFVNHKEDDDRNEGGELDEGFKTTSKLWYKAYGEVYEDKDTNYKGRISDERKRVFEKNRSVTVKLNDEWRRNFVAKAVCSKCKDTNVRSMCVKCGKALLKEIRVARSGQVKGGACAALYIRGYVGSLTMYSKSGGACGGLVGSPQGGAGCGHGGGIHGASCGACACAGAAGGCGGAGGGCVGAACGAGGCGAGACGYGGYGGCAGGGGCGGCGCGGGC